MAVHDKAFRPYEGPRTPSWGRFLVVARYAFGDVLRRRRTLAALVACLFVPLGAAVTIYLHHNSEALAILQIRVDQLFSIDARFFNLVLLIQTVLAFVLFLAAGGATLVSADMRDNALALYLGRPLSRFEYVLGKLTVLAVLGLTVTSGLVMVLAAFQTALEPGWLLANPRVPVGILVGGTLAVAVLALVCLASSALMRAKAAAEGLYLSFFILLPIVGAILEETLDMPVARVLNPGLVVDQLTRWTFGLPVEELRPLPAALACAAILGLCVVILARRVRAYEVVK